MPDFWHSFLKRFRARSIGSPSSMETETKMTHLLPGQTRGNACIFPDTKGDYAKRGKACQRISGPQTSQIMCCINLLNRAKLSGVVCRPCRTTWQPVGKADKR